MHKNVILQSIYYIKIKKENISNSYSGNELVEFKTMEDYQQKLQEYQSLDFDEYKKIALGALKYYILKVDPKKNILFNPEESIDLSGNTGPFIQYAYVRIQSILKKVNKEVTIDNNYQLNDKEKEVLKIIYEFPSVIISSYKDLSPALIANYLYELVKNYNSLYQNHHICG